MTWIQAFQKAPAFCPSLFVDIRKRMDDKVCKEFEQSLTDEIEKIQSGKTVKHKPKTLPDKNTDEIKARQNSDNKGTLIVDATIADQDIRYPTDLSLLNEAREISEKIIDVLYKQSSRTQKPRTYRQKARKAFIFCAKQKRLSLKKRRQGIKKQVQYLRRNLSHIESLLDEQILHQTLETIVQRGFPLSKKWLRQYHIIQHLYQQQRELYRENKRSIADRIVSLHQPQVRPMVRGKAGKKVELGDKLGVAIDANGVSYVDHLS